MISKDSLHKFQQRWAALVRQQKDLDLLRMQWAKDLRAEFKNGAVGDQQFMTCCIELLKIESGEAKNLLVQANISAVVKDEKSIKIIGGANKLAALCLYPKKEQVAIAEIAVRETRSIGSAIQHFEIAQGRREAPPPSISHKEWALRFAKYIKATRAEVPEDIAIGLKEYLGS